MIAGKLPSERRIPLELSGPLIMLAILSQATLARGEVLEATCGPVSVTEPAQFQVESARPTIAWLPVPAAVGYRVKVDSRLPQGEKVATMDVQVTSPSFIPASPLAETRAKVRVEITPLCQTGPGAPVLHQFYIDTALACGEVSDLSLETVEGKRRLTWRGPATAIRYGIWVYTPDKGQLLAKAELREARWDLPEDLRGPAMLSLKPYCPAGQGTFSFLAL